MSHLKYKQHTTRRYHLKRCLVTHSSDTTVVDGGRQKVLTVKKFVFTEN